VQVLSRYVQMDVVCSLSCAGGIGFHYGPVRQVSAACEKIYAIMAEVIPKRDK
jgi:hypothetical protein